MLCLLARIHSQVARFTRKNLDSIGFPIVLSTVYCVHEMCHTFILEFFLSGIGLWCPFRSLRERGPNLDICIKNKWWRLWNESIQPYCHLLVSYRSSWTVKLPSKSSQLITHTYTHTLYCFFKGVVIAAHCTATFSELLCSPEFRYY